MTSSIRAADSSSIDEDLRNYLELLLDFERSGARVDAALMIYSDPRISDDSAFDTLSISLRREGDMIRVPNIAFGRCHKHRGFSLKRWN